MSLNNLTFDFIDCLFLGPLLAIGIITAYTDIKLGKIHNKVIIRGFLYVLFIFLFLFLYSFIFTSNRININYILLIFINGLIALIVGYILWNLKLWSAGDAKLFSLYTFLIPLRFYSKSYIDYFPSFNLLVNVFFPLLFFLIISAIITSLSSIFKKEIKFDYRKIIFLSNLKSVFLKILKKFLTFSFAFLFIRYLISLFFIIFQFEINPFFIFFVIILIMKPIYSLEKKFLLIKYGIWFSVIIWFIYHFLLDDFTQITGVLKLVLFFMVVINLTKNILDIYIKNKEVKKVKLKNIKRGMVILKEDLSSIFEKNKTLEKKLERIDASGLNENQINIIKEFLNSDNLEVRIYNTFSFAPFLFLGAIISILTQNSFLPLVNNFLNYIIK